MPIKILKKKKWRSRKPNKKDTESRRKMKKRKLLRMHLTKWMSMMSQAIRKSAKLSVTPSIWSASTSLERDRQRRASKHLKNRRQHLWKQSKSKSKTSSRKTSQSCRMKPKSKNSRQRLTSFKKNRNRKRNNMRMNLKRSLTRRPRTAWKLKKQNASKSYRIRKPPPWRKPLLPWRLMKSKRKRILRSKRNLNNRRKQMNWWRKWLKHRLRRKLTNGRENRIKSSSMKKKRRLRLNWEGKVRIRARGRMTSRNRLKSKPEKNSSSKSWKNKIGRPA